MNLPKVLFRLISGRMPPRYPVSETLDTGTPPRHEEFRRMKQRRVLAIPIGYCLALLFRKRSGATPDRTQIQIAQKRSWIMTPRKEARMERYRNYGLLSGTC